MLGVRRLKNLKSWEHGCEIKNSMHKKWFYSVLFALIVFIDRITKWAIVLWLPQEPFHVMPGMDFVFALNRGISFSLFSSSSMVGYSILTMSIFIALCAFVVYTYYEYCYKKNIIGEVLVFAGATSNFFDRVYYGGVIDFIDCFIGPYHWYTFNCADIAIVFGITLIMGRVVYDEYYAKGN